VQQNTNPFEIKSMVASDLHNFRINYVFRLLAQSSAAVVLPLVKSNLSSQKETEENC